MSKLYLNHLLIFSATVLVCIMDALYQFYETRLRDLLHFRSFSRKVEDMVERFKNALCSFATNFSQARRSGIAFMRNLKNGDGRRRLWLAARRLSGVIHIWMRARAAGLRYLSYEWLHEKITSVWQAVLHETPDCDFLVKTFAYISMSAVGLVYDFYKQLRHRAFDPETCSAICYLPMCWLLIFIPIGYISYFVHGAICVGTVALVRKTSA